MPEFRRSRPTAFQASVSMALALLVWAAADARAPGAEVTLRGSLVCDGACVPEPKEVAHDLALFAIDGTEEVRAEVERIMKDLYPEKGLDAEAAQKLLDRFTERLKFHIAPDSPALKEIKRKGAGHYCLPAEARAVTGTVSEKDGKKWITATRIEPCRLTFPARMLEPDKPFVMPSREPLVLKVGDKLTLKCVHIPAGKFLMGTPHYMYPYYVEEYPHLVALTRDYYLAEIPVTQQMYEEVMGVNPSVVKDPQLPVQNPTFADIEKFCAALSEKNGKKVRLPTSAEWEYAARVGTSNPGFAEKYKEQNSSGNSGFKEPLKVKSKKANAWGLYDMASCWWEITGDKAMYHVRRSVVDPHYPPGAENARSQRTGRGNLGGSWSIATHEFITEKGGYAGQKFRVLVEIEAKDAKP
jgi:formylglycine-generating enzyme required for sulfatase activity